jgi:hypothetical protein
MPAHGNHTARKLLGQLVRPAVATALLGYCLAGSAQSEDSPGPAGGGAVADPVTAAAADEEPAIAAAEEEYEELELFEAMKQDLVGVLVEPRNFFLLKLSLRNKTDRPLLIHPPEVFAAIPAQRVVAAETLQAFGVGPAVAGYADPSAQGLGGSFYEPDSAHQPRGGNPAAGGFSRADARLPRWRLQPGQIISAPVPCFCLEYGKPDPHPRIPYLLRPLTDLTRNDAVSELLIQFARQQHSQRVTQLALWHVANQVPWPALAQSQLPRSVAGRHQRFTVAELNAARLLVESLPAFRPRFQPPANR